MFEKYEDAASPDAVAFYFNQLYAYTLDDRKSMDFKRAFSAAFCGVDGFGFDFAQYARDFRLIDNNTQPLVIVTEENRKEVMPLLEAVAHGGMSVMRQLQKYSVSLRPYEFERLNSAGVICSEKGVNYLDCERYYNRETGICFENNEACIW